MKEDNKLEDHIIKIQSSQYGDCVEFDDYGGKFSLCAARESQNGAVYKDWAFPQDKDRKPRAKAIPVKVLLGSSKAEAIQTLQACLAFLQGQDAAPSQQQYQEANEPYPDSSYADGNGPAPVDKDDIPF